MKTKLQVKVYLLFFALAGFFQTNQAQKVPFKILTNSEIQQAPVIDGDTTDAAWTTAKAHHFAFQINESNPTSLPFNGYFKVCLDTTFFYFFATNGSAGPVAEIDPDDELQAAEPWNYDNIEFFFDPDTNNDEGTGAYVDDATQIRYNRGVAASDANFNTGYEGEDNPYRLYKTTVPENEWTFDYVTENNGVGGGWRIEGRIPWEAILPKDTFQLMKDLVIGYDIIMQTKANGRISWANSLGSDNSWKDTRLLGRMRMDVTSDIDEIITGGSVSCYPNPAENYIIVENNGRLQNIQVVDIFGNVIKVIEDIAAAQIQINIHDLASGMYLVKTTDSKGNSYLQKIIKQ